MDSVTSRIGEVGGLGGDGRVSPDDLAKFKAALAEARNDTEGWLTMRAQCLRARFNRWSGQSLDGRKWAHNLDYEPEPFDGGSDQRVWWVDQVIREQETLRTVALQRATLRCEPRNGRDDGRVARALTVLLRWLRDRLGTTWIEEHRKLTNYELGDSPGVALMRIWWKEKVTLTTRTMTVDEVASLWQAEYIESLGAAGVQAPPVEAMQEAVEGFILALQGEGDEDSLEAMLRRFFPRLTAGRARQVVRELRNEGEASFPVPEIAYAGPAISARRLVDDFIVPNDMMDFENCALWFEPEWISRPELKRRQATEGWSRGFVEDVLENEGVAAVPEYEESDSGTLVEVPRDERSGMYQVVWVWFEASNVDGVPAKYYAVMHPKSERTAFGRRLYDAPGGRWPGVFHRREIRDKWGLNSRSVAEIEAPAQYGVKLLRDVAVDNANIGGLPPFVTYGHSNKGNIDLGPLAHLPVRQGGDAKFMQPPAFPAAARSVINDMRQERDNYWARPGEGVDPTMAAAAREAEVLNFMGRVRDELQVILDLALSNMSAEELGRVLDDDGAILADMSPSELAGQYDVQIIFDPADLDATNVIERCTALRNVLMGIDTDKRIDTSRFVEWGVRALFPQVAAEGLRRENEGLEREMEEEAANYARLRAGDMPRMNTAGAWNYAARRQYYETLVQNNPAVFDDLAPDKRAMLQQWLAALEQQAQQYGDNATVGRVGAEGVPEEE